MKVEDVNLFDKNWIKLAAAAECKENIVIM
jgi:hypothetical protein